MTALHVICTREGPMTKSRFSPQNPAAVHERFERIKARAIRSAEQQLRTVLRTHPVSATGQAPGLPGHGTRRGQRREDHEDDEE
jgi:hypothetical protein